MPKPPKFQLTAEQLQAVEQGLLNPKPKHRRRAQALKLLHEGHSVTTVAHEVGVSRQSIYKWTDQIGVRENTRQQEIAFIQAILDALQEKEWDFEDLHSTLEQRLSRSIDPLDLKVRLVMIRYHCPELPTVTLPQ